MSREKKPPLIWNGERVENLVISFSGGETSAYLCWWMVNNREKYCDNLHVVFANTGQEHVKTLEFVDRCDREWNFGVTWLESEIPAERGVGPVPRVVDFKTASRPTDRAGNPFEEFIKKYGLPNVAHPECTKPLKQVPIDKYYNELLGRRNRPRIT